MSDILDTPAPREVMTNYRAVGLAEGFIDAEDEQEVIEAWQFLVDTGLAWQLQGWFGRTARDLIEAGIITEKVTA